MEYLLKASIVIAIFFCVYVFFLKKETFFKQNRRFLLMGLVVAVSLPLVVIPIEIPVDPVSSSYQFSTIDMPTTIHEAKASERQTDWPMLLSILYSLGLVLFIGQFILQFGSLILLLLKNPKLKDGIYTYVIVKNNISPFSFFKWIVYNPDCMDNKEIQLMLTHEKVHVKQLHSLDIVLCQLACAIFWFNPLMWLYRNYIRQNLEYIADYETQSSTANSKMYQKLLLKTSILNQHELLTTNFYNSSIKKRIVMLQTSRSQTKKQWRYLLVLPLLGVVLLSMNTKEVYVAMKPTENIETSTAYKNPEIEIIFTKSTTDTQLDEIEDELKANDISMKIKTLERNEKGLITSIDVDFKTPNGSANYAVIDQEGISDFYFRQSEDGSFGVGAAATREKIIVKDVNAGFIDSEGNHNTIIEENNNGKSVNKIIIHEGEDHKTEFIIEGDSTDIKIVNGKIFFSGNKDSTIRIKRDSLSSGINWTNENNFTYVVGSSPDSLSLKENVVIGYKSNDSELEEHVVIGYNADSIYSKSNSNIKGVPRQKVKYKINTDNEVEGYEIVEIKSKFGNKPLYIINGEAQVESIFKNLDSKKIKSMTVLKEDNAVKMYGEKAKDGVIIVETQESVKNNKPKSKWVVRTEVNSIGYVDDEDESKNATLAYISKYTSDDILKKNKALLEEVGLKVKYSKKRRNKKGEITRIKISIADDKAAESSATWKNDDGIPGIEYGRSEGVLIARTSKQSFSQN